MNNPQPDYSQAPLSSDDSLFNALHGIDHAGWYPCDGVGSHQHTHDSVSHTPRTSSLSNDQGNHSVPQQFPHQPPPASVFPSEYDEFKKWKRMCEHGSLQQPWNPQLYSSSSTAAFVTPVSYASVPSTARFTPTVSNASGPSGTFESADESESDDESESSDTDDDDRESNRKDRDDKEGWDSDAEDGYEEWHDRGVITEGSILKPTMSSRTGTGMLQSGRFRFNITDKRTYDFEFRWFKESELVQREKEGLEIVAFLDVVLPSVRSTPKKSSVLKWTPVLGWGGEVLEMIRGMAYGTLDLKAFRGSYGAEGIAAMLEMTPDVKEQDRVTPILCRLGFCDTRDLKEKDKDDNYVRDFSKYFGVKEFWVMAEVKKKDRGGGSQRKKLGMAAHGRSGPRGKDNADQRTKGKRPDKALQEGMKGNRKRGGERAGEPSAKHRKKI